MRKLNISIGILAIAIVTLTTMSCKDTKKGHNNEDGHHSEQMEENGHMGGSTDDHSTMDHGNMESPGKMTGVSKNGMMSSQIIGDYLELKNALVADDKEAAAKAGGNLVSAFGNFDKSKFNEEQQLELIDIIEDAIEHAEHIAKSPIGHQREHFDVLSKDVIDLIAITGTEKTLYQDFCPMYNDKKGAQWLSESKEIKNPYYGSKMLTCGSIQKQIN